MFKSDAEKGFSRKSTQVVGNRMKLETSRWVHQTIGVPEMKRTGRFGYSATNFRAISVPAEWGRSISETNGHRPTNPSGFYCLQTGVCLQNGISFRSEHGADALQIGRIVVQNENGIHKNSSFVKQFITCGCSDMEPSFWREQLKGQCLKR